MGNIFISYAKEDKDQVQELNDALVNQGYSVWLDYLNLLPGQEWKPAIEEAIRQSDIFIACLSNNSINKQGFVQAELRRALEVAELMPEGTIYVIPVRMDECKVPDSLSKWQWLDYFDVSEKNKLFKAIQLRINPAPLVKVEQEKYFDAGERVKVVRNELGVNTSQFIEILDLPSQRDYEAMEACEKEFPLSLLKKVSDISGIRLEWLKHEEGHKYNIEVITLARIKDDLEYCASLKPQEYYFTFDKKQLHAGIVVQVSKYRFQVLETGTSLDFWNWIDSHWAIARFYHFLDELTNSWHDIQSVFLPTSIDRKLYDGDIHFLTAIRNSNGMAVGFLYDLLDLDNSQPSPFPAAKIYGISSFRKIQDYFKEYLQKEESRFKRNR